MREAMLRAGFRKSIPPCKCCGVPYTQCYKLREATKRIREEYISKGIILEVTKGGKHEVR